MQCSSDRLVDYIMELRLVTSTVNFVAELEISFIHLALRLLVGIITKAECLGCVFEDLLPIDQTGCAVLM